MGERVAFAKSIKFKAAGIALELVSEVAKRGIVESGSIPAVADTSETKEQEFARLSEEYRVLDTVDIVERVGQRRRLADRLGVLVKSSSRTVLANGPEGDIVAVATAILLSPKRGDLAVLAKAAKAVQFKFTGYRLVLALTAILASPPTSKRRLQNALEILTEIEVNVEADADPDLQRVIEQTRRLILDLQAT